MNRGSVIRLLMKIDQRGPDECWPWKAARNRDGYGVFWLDGRNIHASRATYLLLVGPVPDDVEVCHTCDNPPCCNPVHLFKGTRTDNVHDCVRKGRARGLFTDKGGAAHPRYTAKLTPELVLEARRRYAAGESQSQISRELGVHSSTISRAVRGEKWSHL